MKYIEADKLKTEIDDVINGLRRRHNPNPFGTLEQCLASAEIETLILVKEIIDKM